VEFGGTVPERQNELELYVKLIEPPFPPAKSPTFPIKA
jgi:hypothetical protein